MRIIAGLGIVLVGAALFWFRKEYAAHAIRDQNRLWGFHFGERTIRGEAILSGLAGICLIIGGVLLLLGFGHANWLD
ncbi:MAG: hypothetical protein ACYC35_15175 [Pirellulales bacterium]